LKVKKLTMQAFGPYAERTEIDFSLLGDGGIYIITGATGSGKTSIFDGISFALYGKASGEERSFEDMRCSYADSSAETFVSLDFEHIGKSYSVRRSPRYERAKARGSGTTVQNSSATLILPDGSAITGEAKVTARVCEIIGLDREQYARTAMIAQGDFYKILYASTAERVEIFRKIFSTGNYGELQRRLFEEAKAAETQCLSARRAIEEKIFSVLGDGADTSDFASAKEAMEASLAAGVAEWNAAKEGIARLTAERDGLKAVLEKEEAYINAKRRLEDIAEEEKSLLAERLTAENSLKALKEKENERALSAAFIADSSLKRGLYVRRDELIKKINSLQNELIFLGEREKNLSALIEKQKEALSAYREEYSSLENARAEKVDLLHKKENAEKRVGEIASAARLVKELKKTEAEYLSAAEAFKAAEEKRALSADKYERAYSLFLRNQAGLLAEKLNEGEACPVCGSLIHPRKAETEENAPDSEGLKQIKGEKDRAEEAAKRLSERAGALYSALSVSAKTCAESLKKFTSVGGESPADIWSALPAMSEVKTAAEDEVKRISCLFSAAEKKEKRYSELSSIISDCEKYINSYSADKDEALLKRGALENEKAKADGELSAIRTDFPDLKAFDAALKEKEGFISSFDGEKRAAEEKLSSCAAAISTLGGRKKALEDALSSSLKPDGRSAEKLSLAEKRIEELTEKKELIRSVNREKKAAVDFIGEKLPAYEKSLSFLKTVKTLSDVANGSLSGKSKIKIETFVQMRCFDRILARANIRLENMTGGEYTLVRRESSSASSTGLELDILDNYKLIRREVGTLSGGESFMASLALALGLSDEVQSSRGGVRIDSMFLDEGFGTLSDEALNGAVNTLASLSDGRISIGVISHVKELERRIDKKIIVTKTPSGSFIKIEN